MVRYGTNDEIFFARQNYNSPFEYLAFRYVINDGKTREERSKVVGRGVVTEISAAEVSLFL